MQLFIDFLPIALFFLAFKTAGLYVATAVAIVASLLQVLYTRYKTGYFQKMSLMSLLVISVLGGATLLLRDETFIKWKPTAVYWLLALFFLGSHFMDQPLLKRLMGTQINLSLRIWQGLNLSWFLFFFFLGALNLYVVRRFDTPTWVNFKLFGCLGLTLLFVIAQGLYMSKHHQPTEGGHQ